MAACITTNAVASPGTFCGTGSTWLQCATLCPVGTWSAGGTTTAALSGCTQCAAGTYNPLLGQTSAAACKACDAGFTSTADNSACYEKFAPAAACGGTKAPNAGSLVIPTTCGRPAFNLNTTTGLPDFLLIPTGSVNMVASCSSTAGVSVSSCPGGTPQVFPLGQCFSTSTLVLSTPAACPTGTPATISLAIALNTSATTCASCTSPLSNTVKYWCADTNSCVSSASLCPSCRFTTFAYECSNLANFVCPASSSSNNDQLVLLLETTLPVILGSTIIALAIALYCVIKRKPSKVADASASKTEGVTVRKVDV